MEPAEKQRLALRGKCLASIIESIDNIAESEQAIELDYAYKIRDEIVIEEIDRLSNNDVEGIFTYVDAYLGMMSRKNITVNGNINTKTSRKWARHLASQYRKS